MKTITEYPNFFKAEDALKTSETFHNLKNIAKNIYDNIKEAAEKGLYSITFDVSNQHLNHVQVIIDELESRGYKTRRNNNILIIYWKENG